MDWDGSLTRSSFVNPRPDSSNASSFSSFLFNCSFDQFPGNMEVKHQYPHHPLGMGAESSQAALGLGAENYISSGYLTYNNQERKKKLTNEQIESLERSFEEDIKLDIDRKKKLSRELGLQPRQIAVWFQNRRARWKAKQLERLYEDLKLDFDAISRENLKLQQEVLLLKSMIRDQATRKNTVGYTELSGKETVESTSINMPPEAATTHHHHHHQFGVEYNNAIPAAATYWGSIGPSIYNNTSNQ